MNYKKMVDKATPSENKYKNMIYAFLSGGIIGLISEVIAINSSVDVMLMTWIILASLLTGFGMFDNIADKFKMGVIIPISGFAHSITSSSIEYKKEGLITGIGSNYMKLAGSVILYGIVSTFLMFIIRSIVW